MALLNHPAVKDPMKFAQIVELILTEKQRRVFGCLRKYIQMTRKLKSALRLNILRNTFQSIKLERYKAVGIKMMKANQEFNHKSMVFYTVLNLKIKK